MAKRRTGSLQKKGEWYYFVARGPDGRVKWTALHTKDQAEAEQRAQVHLGSALRIGDRQAWLQSLVDAGDWARRELAGADAAAAADALTWTGLFAAWRSAAPRLTAHRPTLDNYGLQVGGLVRWATENGIASPQGVGAAQAQAFAAGRHKEGVDAGRDTALFKRVWRDLALPPVWTGVRTEGAQEAGRYRRMTVDEVRKVVKALRTGHEAGRTAGKWTAGKVTPLPDVADLVTLAYHTGLRRADCVGLTVGNVDAGGEYLRVIARKTKKSKGRPLLIPLQPEARELVARLQAEAGAGADVPLFPRLADAWLNKCLRLAWSRAGVRSDAFGRASFHSLRATFISMMDEAGIAPHLTDAITGHASQGMHGRYSQPGREALMEAVTRAITPLGVSGGTPGVEAVECKAEN